MPHIFASSPDPQGAAVAGRAKQPRGPERSHIVAEETNAAEVEETEERETESEREETREEEHENTDQVTVTVLRSENQRLKREAAEREKERRKAEAAARKAEETRKADQGQWKELAEEREREIDALKGEITERDRKDAERDQRSTVEKVADKLNYRRPRKAYALLLDELDEEDASNTLADEQLTEAALRRLAKDMPELVDNQRRSGAPVGGRGNGGQPTPEQEHLDFLRQIGVGAPQ
jgi:colicin import membrane protein